MNGRGWEMELLSPSLITQLIGRDLEIAPTSRDSEIAPTGLRGEETEFWGKNSVSAGMVGVYLAWGCSEVASGAAWAISAMASSGLT